MALHQQSYVQNFYGETGTGCTLLRERMNGIAKYQWCLLLQESLFRQFCFVFSGLFT